MENITQELALIAKNKGCTINNCTCGGYPDCICKYKINISYHQLIDWLFKCKFLIEFNRLKELEFWYNLLKDCPLKYEFKGRLLEWFRSINRHLYIEPYWINVEDIKELPEYCPWVIDEEMEGAEEPVFYKTYSEAEHNGILEVFKLIKNKTI